MIKNIIRGALVLLTNKWEEGKKEGREKESMEQWRVLRQYKLRLQSRLLPRVRDTLHSERVSE